MRPTVEEKMIVISNDAATRPQAKEELSNHVGPRPRHILNYNYMTKLCDLIIHSQKLLKAEEMNSNL